MRKVFALQPYFEPKPSRVCNSNQKREESRKVFRKEARQRRHFAAGLPGILPANQVRPLLVLPNWICYPFVTSAFTGAFPNTVSAR
jgi:hypothetical protein